MTTMIWKARWLRISECLCRRPGVVLILLPCLLVVTLYLVSNDDYKLEHIQYPSYRFYNVTEDVADGYLVWNPKCHMLLKDPMDPSIVKFVKKEKYEACTNKILFTQIYRESNGSSVLFLDPEMAATHHNVTCCWSAVSRPSYDKVDKPLKDNFDSTITVKPCEPFKNQVILPADVEVVMVSCKTKAKVERKKSTAQSVYENVHAILNPDKVRDRLEYNNSIAANLSRKLSVLVLGIDSVSRLNFKRSMPKTEKYLRETGWLSLRGYNKMGDNTFPNLMAILTGQSQQQAYATCKPTVAYKLDRCPFIWHNFRNVGYITAYGEDETVLNTFNYLKVGFVHPPTDYYLRPYMLASEKLLGIKRRFSLKYCTGPEMSFERIFDYAVKFALTFMGAPYFGFFWTNTLSHDNMNGPSSMDPQILEKFRHLERKGALNDTMVIFLSDHGMRYGGIRNTFVGWYEERLPFVYLWLPQWYRDANPEAYQALRTNENRLTSPFDLYETLRDVLMEAGGTANSSTGCERCQTLLKPVPRERGCEDAGIAPHWCTCTAFTPVSTTEQVVVDGANKFIEHVESVVKVYKGKKGKRLCARLKLKKIHRVDRVVDFANSSSTVAYFYLIQVSPGDGKFEVTIRYHGNGNYTVSDDEVSRINPYAMSAKCLNHGLKQYCCCIK